MMQFKNQTMTSKNKSHAWTSTIKLLKPTELTVRGNIIARIIKAIRLVLFKKIRVYYEEMK